MARSEAKIKFTAETGAFNKAISQANSKMKELSAELSLNRTQMARNGTTVEGLEKKHEILSAQLKTSEDKTSALNQKVQKAIEIYGENSTEVSKLRTQLLNAQKAEEKIRMQIDSCNDALAEQRRAMGDAGDSAETMTDKVSRQESELKSLKRAYADIVSSGGEASDEADQLAKEISDLSGELKQNKDALQEASDKADKLDKSFDDAGDSANSAGDGFTVMKGVVADLASSAIQMAIGKISEFVGYLKELPEATRELRQDFATLDTSFDNVGLSSEQAKNTWKELYAVFGEDDRAVETANHIAKMSDNQKDLNDWVTITTGVWGTYQDSLPVEGLAEASNETAKTGSVTGVLADALNWGAKEGEKFGVKMKANTEANEEWNKAVSEAKTAEDYFNLALSECSTEQERQQLITSTLTSMYGDAAEKYRETSGAQMEAKEATAENIQAEADLATAIEPVTTAFTELKTSLLESCAPAIEKVSGLMTDALAWAQEHPVAMKVLAGVLGTLAVAFSGLAIALGVYTVAQWLANSAIAPMILPIMGVVAAIAAVVAIIIVVVEYWDVIVEACKNAWEKVKETLSQWGEWINTNVIQPVKQFFSDLWSGIKETASNLWEGVKSAWSSFTTWIDTSIIQPVIGFFKGLWDGIKAVWDGICNAVQVAIMFIGSIISGAFQLITLPFRFIWENCKDTVISVWNAIKSGVSTAINAVKNTITTVFNAVKNFFTTVWNGIKNVFTTVWNGIVSFLTPIINKIKSVITTTFNAVKNTVTTIFNAIKSVVTTVWNAIKSAITTVVNAIKSVVSSVFNAIKSTVTSIFNAVKNTVSNVWNGIKNTISNVVNAVKSKVSSVFNSVKSTVSSVFNGIKSTATSVWNGIKNAITTPIEAAKNKVKSIIDTIKGFFSNLKLKLPNIKLPHFKISGKFSLDPPSVPKLKIDWYKDGGIMTRPTIFGMNGNSLMAGGEAGAEAILPIDRLEGYIENVIERTMPVVNLQALADAVEDLANRPISLNINGRQFALATASDGDNVNGLRTSLRGRGLVLG